MRLSYLRPVIFDLESIVVATDNFSPANKLGQGGFGSVYKGLLASGQEVAVKRLSMNSGQDQIQANTNRVVGTDGYMSPEYAMHGRYSTKSDVFSFGVLLLEIISGKRNTDYNPESPTPNLIGKIWDIWREGRALEIVDPSLGQSYPDDKVSKCIQIGLLCVQECATDRPTMLEAVFMLGNETTLPSPKKPAFIFQSSNPNSEASRGGPASINDVTITMLEAR
ncbi:hypothetical protein M0R45_013050 [Rubus argutus]|uniref:Protein kinase domain-containing protein n=1 Tax=Rubus argutus TaxID=59490 RepID=A0AAW1XKJ5_RUBAR